MEIPELEILFDEHNPRGYNALLLIIFSFNKKCTMAEIKERVAQLGSRVSFSNLPATLTNLKNVKKFVAETKGLWGVRQKGKKHLEGLGLLDASPVTGQIKSNLQKYLESVEDETTRAFAKEAIKCYEYKLYRSAIVMSWVTAVQVLRNCIHKKHLDKFNREAKRRWESSNQGKPQGKIKPWKPIRTTDDLARFNEKDFLEIICVIGVIGKDVKEELGQRLRSRNNCAHPSSLKMRDSAVAHHLEILLLNVFSRNL